MKRADYEICEGCCEVIEWDKPLHNLGGVCFEATGEMRQVDLGEWYTTDEKQTPYYRSWNFDSPTASPFVILRPVRVEAPQ